MKNLNGIVRHRVWNAVLASCALAVQERLAKLGVEPMPMSLEQFEKFFREDVAANVQLVKAAHIPTQ